jgi:hypothetical protein
LVGPGCTSKADVSFSAPFADTITAKYGSKFTLLAQHSYVAAANSSGCSVPNLQITTTQLTDIFDTIQAAATKNNLPGWRMDENNTCSGHGQQGLSDTLISGLWAIDYMFEVAKRGGSGVNFESDENGMDGAVPFYYEPLKENGGVVVAVQPEYYGMLLFTQAGQGPMVSTTVSTSAQYFTAWAIKANGFTSVVLNNRNASSGVNATVNLGAAVSSASVIYLEGTPAGNLTAAPGNVTLAGAQVSVAGDWPRNPPYVQTVSGNSVSVYVPPASAALVRVLQSAMTLAEACTKNCALASGLPTCSTTTTECEQNCMTTYDNTSAVNPDLGRMYTEMMVCVATNPKFASSADFVCAKPNYPLNKWSPGPDSDCEQLICDWNCNDVTYGNMDPWVDIRCSCSTV